MPIQTRLIAAFLPFVLLMSAQPQRPEQAARPPTPTIEGTWFVALSLVPGTAQDFYQTFTGTNGWKSVMVFRDKNGKITRRTARGSYTLTAVGDGAYRIVTTPCDYAPRHTCIEHGACSDWPAVSSSSDTVRFKDPSHLQLVTGGAVLERLQQLPIEATEPVLSIIMQTVSGEPSNAANPIGLDSAPGRIRCTECDDLQQLRLCTLGDKGHITTNANGCKVCTE